MTPYEGTFVNNDLTSKATIVNLIEDKFRINWAKLMELFTVWILAESKAANIIVRYLTKR